MAKKGKHRRPKSSSLTRSVVAAGTGGAALVLPMMAATGANAADSAKSSAPEKSSAAATAEKSEKKKDAPATYSVVAGDYLSKIAQDQSVDGGWKRLYQDNRKAVGDDPSLIRPGLKLTINAPATSKSQEKPASDTTASKTSSSESAEPATYSDDLDGWIKESLAVMAEHGIPGSYEGIERNILRESSGNPSAVNNWDSNAAAGTPSKGLLQVIPPTFEAYHVPGTSTDIFDPVANITAACNYAADNYGSIDNVDGPY
ncbi:transglycosylase SLT domain-containing protein [Streptomyces sp. SCSIO ZS0520]|uniref:Secreted peptidase n=1 Tax=Streptomyces albus (strain ATCC 21838 / DSM 41398 / FERM P-419 / JCM 4703 / NBRC 107858) TaxID=1081613 RepID=A0A0B5FB35_STRA4|nr:LysM peptidoglycan-binding domain-containing protein [Streptomyces sp. SCSIO ZS0520]AJE87672.1 secreted peptidase [Streptomyces albus]